MVKCNKLLWVLAPTVPIGPFWARPAATAVAVAHCYGSNERPLLAPGFFIPINRYYQLYGKLPQLILMDTDKRSK
jgi:hypothetical protein